MRMRILEGSPLVLAAFALGSTNAVACDWGCAGCDAGYYGSGYAYYSPAYAAQPYYGYYASGYYLPPAYNPPAYNYVAPVYYAPTYYAPSAYAPLARVYHPYARPYYGERMGYAAAGTTNHTRIAIPAPPSDQRAVVASAIKGKSANQIKLHRFTVAAPSSANAPNRSQPGGVAVAAKPRPLGFSTLAVKSPHGANLTAPIAGGERGLVPKVTRAHPARKAPGTISFGQKAYVASTYLGVPVDNVGPRR
jgi:hypothetical protein